MKSVNACMSASVIGPSRPSRPGERDVELLERRVLVERDRRRDRCRRCGRRASASGRGSPCRAGSASSSAPSSDGSPDRRRRVAIVIGFGLLSDVVVGVAEVPREAVEVAEDVAARARRLAVARRGDARRRGTAGRSTTLRRLGVVQRHVRDLAARSSVSTTETRVVEAGEHVEPARAPRRARARSGRRRVTAMWFAALGTNVSFSSCGRVEDADLARAEGGDVERRAVAASPPCRPASRGSSPCTPAGSGRTA